MTNKKVKCVMAAALAGTMLGGGCLGNLPWQSMFTAAAISVGTEFFLDNDSVFDLFEDGDPTAAEE